MSPVEAEVVWRGASDEKETIGDGRVTADIGFDHARRALTGLTVSGRLGASESRWEGGHVKSAEKTFEYVYAESPLKFAFSYSSAGDFVKGELMPLGMGPFGLMPACTRLRMSGCRASQRISYWARIWRTCPASVPTEA